MASKQHQLEQRQRRRLPPDHPLHAYVDDCRASIELIQEDPQLLVSSAELTFLNEFVRNANRDADHGDRDGRGSFVDEGTDANDEAVVDSSDVEAEEEGEESEDYWADDSSPYEYTGSDGSAVFYDDDDDEGDKIETYDTVIIGAGPAGLGLATSLLAGGHLRSTLLVLERDAVGSTFDAWPTDTRFISPSWDSGAFGPVDLNAIEANGDPGTQPSAFYRGEEEDEEESGWQCGQQNGSPPILGGSQHPSGKQYARYLRSVAVRRRIPIRERCNVTFIRRIDGTDAWPSGAYEVEFEEKMTARKRTIYSRYVVWCGGEFGLPNTPSGEGFEGENQKAWKHYAHLGRTHEEWNALAEKAAENPVPVPNSNSDSGTNITSHAIVVGAYEAGVDTACALLRRGVGHITLVDAEDYIAGWPLSLLGGTKQQSGKPEQAVDPSEALSPMSSSRLYLAARSNQVTLMASSRCTGVSLRADGTFEASIVASTNDVAATTATKIFASIPIIFCTGFDSSRCHLINQLFKWSKGGSPIVSQDCDESTTSPGLFLCGPSLRHFVAKSAAASQGEDSGCERIAGNCYADARADEEKSSKDVADGGEDREELVEIIFCFIYKYRSRFPIVAGEILSRMVHETHTETTDKHGIVIDRVGMERLDKVEKMLALYQERGMLTNKLTCALSCTGTY